MRTNDDRKAARITAVDEALDPALDPALQVLRREHRAVDAPKHLSARLQSEAERLAPRKRSFLPDNPLRMAWVWGVSLALLAGLVWGLAAWERRGAGGNLPKQVRLAPHPSSAGSAVAPLAVASTAAETHRSEGIRRSLRARDAEPSMKDFLPLPASEGLPPTSAVSLVRMRITTGALQQYGLDVPEGAASEMLLAEFVVGEDGLPRAIRILP